MFKNYVICRDLSAVKGVKISPLLIVASITVVNQLVSYELMLFYDVFI